MVRRAAFVFSVLLAFLFSVSSFALSSRTFVSSTGNDANACTPAAPCRSFAAAIGQASAGAEVVALDSAGFGSFTVNMSIQVVAAPGVLASVSTGGGATAVQINASFNDVVVLRGISFSGPGALHAVNFSSGSILHIEKCTFQGFGNVNTIGATIEVDRVIAGDVADVHISDTVVRGAPGGTITSMGVRVDSTGTNAKIRVTLENSRFEHLSYGLVILSNGYLVAADSLVANNGYGVLLQPAAGNAEAIIERSRVVNNGNGLAAGGGAGTSTIYFAQTVVGYNAQGLSVNAAGGTAFILSRRDNTIEGNAAGNTAPNQYLAK